MTGFRDMWIFHFRCSWKCPYQPILARFWGWSPKHNRYCQQPWKALNRKRAFWRMDHQDQSWNVTSAGKKVSRKRKETRRFDTYVPRPPTLRYPHRSCYVGWVPDVVNHAKFCQNWLRGLNLLFSMLSAMVYITGLSCGTTCDVLI